MAGVQAAAALVVEQGDVRDRVLREAVDGGLVECAIRERADPLGLAVSRLATLIRLPP